MIYKGDVFRPPSEAESLIIQVTLGCTHNKCKFCYMYKNKHFSKKSLAEIKQDINIAKSWGGYYRKLFLADGDALSVRTDELLQVIHHARATFPSIQTVNSYAYAHNILNKSTKELQDLKDAGLDMLYLGLESGSDEVLTHMDKGISVADTILAVQKAQSVGLRTSIMVILGLGGKARTQIHAEQTALCLNQMNPAYLAFLTLRIYEVSPLVQEIERGEFQLLSQYEILDEMRRMILPLELSNTEFRSNHGANFLRLKGTLNQDKEKILTQITRYIEMT